MARLDTEHELASLKLTPRLIDVLALLVQGESNKHIARELDLSLETVKEYVAAILRRLNVNSRTQVPLSVRSSYEALLTWDAARRRTPQSATRNRDQRRNLVHSQEWLGQERRHMLERVREFQVLAEPSRSTRQDRGPD